MIRSKRSVCLPNLLGIFILGNRSRFDVSATAVKRRCVASLGVKTEGNHRASSKARCFHIKAQSHQRKNLTAENSGFQQRLSLVRRADQRMAAAVMSSADTAAISQDFDFFLVLDFEATCDNERPPKPQEVIEFPVLKVNAKTHATDSIFHHYVRPLYNPHLTPFCTELTGIVQEMVDNQQCFPEVMKSFEQWMESEGLLSSEVKSVFVTCGDWDLKSMLPRQLETSRLASKSYFKRWINIKKSYADVTRTFPKGMMQMIEGLNLQHVGRHHSGIDDCRSIANIVVTLMRQGYIFRENGWLK